MEQEDRKKVAYREANLSTGMNIALFIIKISLGIMISSIALQADAFHTLSDISTSLVVLFSFRAATKAPDSDHPFGHGRWEPIATLIIAVMLVVAGIELLIQGIHAGIDRVSGEANVLVAVIVLATALCKEGLARYAMRLGDKIDSSTLRADAWHHRTDAFSSIGVAVAIVFTERFPGIDGAAGVLVALLIIKTGVMFIKDTTNVLLGQAPSGPMLKRICSIAEEVPGVGDIHDILVHDYVSSRIISLHIRVDRSLSIIEAHDIADAVTHKLEEEMNAVVTVHVDLASEDDHGAPICDPP
jgi:cation diffusion facilitator family transporter